MDHFYIPMPWYWTLWARIFGRKVTGTDWDDGAAATVEGYAYRGKLYITKAIYKEPTNDK